MAEYSRARYAGVGWEQSMIRAALSGLLTVVASALAFSHQDALNNPFGFALLLFGPLAAGLLCALPKVTVGTVVRNGVTAAACGAAILGLLVSSNGEEGGLLVVFGAGTAFFVVAVFPVIMAGLFGQWRPR